jgi:hypothetical protein
MVEALARFLGESRMHRCWPISMGIGTIHSSKEISPVKLLPEGQFIFWLCICGFFGIAILLWEYLQAVEQ